MKDLLLFRLLRAPELDPSALTPLLQELAKLSVEDRFPLLGVIAPALAHADASLRAAAIDALAGADGRPAFLHLVNALGDADAGVRRAAVEALRASSLGHPARFAHALFHREDDVRRAAVEGVWPVGVAALTFPLLADPVAGPELLRRFDAQPVAGVETPEPPQITPAALPAVFDFVARGLLPVRIARRLVAAMSWNDPARFLHFGGQRGPEEVRAVLAAAASGPPEPAAVDTFDEVFALFWDDVDEGVEPRRDAFFRKLRAQMVGWPADLRLRAIASLFATAARRGGFPRLAAVLAAVFHPPFLGFSWVPRAVRRESVKAIYAAAGNTPRLPDDEVRALLGIDLCRRDDGSLDLWAIGGILHFVEQHPYSRLLRWIDEEAVIAAFLADVDHAIPFLVLRDDSKHGRDYLVQRVAAAGGFGWATVHAILVVASPAGRFDFLEPHGPEAAAEVIVELFRVLRRMGQDLGTKKITALNETLWKLVKRRELVDQVLRVLLDAENPADLGFAVGVLGALGMAVDGDGFVEIACGLPPIALRRLIAMLPSCSVFPYGKEMALARALKAHDDEVVRAWALDRAPPDAESLPVPRPVERPDVRGLSDAEVHAIVSASDADLPAALAPCLNAPRAGLCDALAQRRPPGAPSVKAGVAILGAHDPMEQVDEQLGRFGASTGAYLSALDAEMVRVWGHEDNVPPLSHAVMHRWERHAFALVEGFLADGGLGAQLSRAAAFTQAFLRESVWDAAASAVMMWRWRDREKLAPLCTPAFCQQLVGALDTELGEAAARMLAAIADARVASEVIEGLRPAIAAKLPDLTPEVRSRLSAIVDGRGLTGSGVVRAASAPRLEENLREKIRRSGSLSDLEAWCRSPNAYLVEEAAIRLCELGELGCERILAVIRGGAPVLGPLFESVSLWNDGASLAAARALAAGEDEDPAKRFRMALALAQRGERAFVAHALAAARAETKEPWFKPSDWDRLIELGQTDRSLAQALASAPHPHAYRRALGHLLTVPEVEVSPAILAAVADFVDAGTDRMDVLRVLAARWLWEHGDTRAFPILLGAYPDAAGHPEHAEPGFDLPNVLAGVAPDLVDAAVEAVLTGGPRGAPESVIMDLLGHEDIDADARFRAYERLLTGALHPATRAFAASHVRGERRSEKLRQLAEAFAWGIRMGRSLTGRLFKVEMTTGQGLGYTRLEESRVYVSPLPILRRVPHGRAIVEGLVLHELGHHLYHRGKEGSEAWKAAQDEGIFGLLNTVADEHLERNLRAVEADFGDRLKRLGAYAFQHASKDVPVADLLDCLGGRAFEVLRATALSVAREEGCVRLCSGALLLQMERSGLAFSRFFRALRMGLGDRHDDPLVREALALCKGIRKRTMPELLDLARRLQQIFGWQTRLVEHIGPHESFENSEAEATIHGEGITREELEREIERVLDPARKARESSGKDPADGKRWINVGTDEHFERLHAVVKVARDPEAHARYASAVQLAARQMRRFFEALGLTLEPERFRLRGRRFDPGRALAVVTRGDPRMLIAREPRLRTDLFVAVIIDCSASMQTRNNIEKARLFGAMLAEAARGVRGVDLRLFGFNDHTMFDAGDAVRCAVHALEPGGGNNDAGALFYAASHARQSRRKAKLLVMISDGLPTECSVAALRGLVRRLGTRHGMCCAQVAVQPLLERCFPHYIELTEGEPGADVRRFGEVIAGLVQKAVALA